MTQLPAKKLMCASAVALLASMPAIAQQRMPTDLTLPAASASVPQAEVPSVTTLPDIKPHWVLSNRGGGMDGTRIFDADTGKMVGMVNMYGQDSFAFDPLGKNFYVAQTLWSKVDRGTRQDNLLVYDAKTLKLTAEIPMQNRMLIGNHLNNLVITADGKRALIYNMQPSSSVHVIDLVKMKYDQKIELPGCATMFANMQNGFSALCSNGSLVTVALDGKKPVLTRSASFFNAVEDPIFDNSLSNPKTGEVTFLSYSGLITSVQLGATPTIGEPWSLQVAASMRKQVYTPMDVNWVPGGRQPLAIHHATGRAYVLMHKGEYWSMYEAAEEVWVIDLKAKKLVKRFGLPDDIRGHAVNVAVSQDADPLVYMSDGGGHVWVLDKETLEKKRTIDRAGGGILYVPQP